MSRVTLVLCALLAVLAAACSGGGSGDAERGFVAGQGLAVTPVAERRAAPPVVAETLDGEELALGDLPGPVVLNFWASWCGPCAQEQPHLVALATEYGPRGVSFVGVDIKDTRANARAFQASFDVPYPSWYDPGASIAAQFGGVGPGALPTTILLDREHRVALRAFGAVTQDLLRPHLDALLAG